jgi:hypothetical protein
VEKRRAPEIGGNFEFLERIVNGRWPLKEMAEKLREEDG